MQPYVTPPIYDMPAAPQTIASVVFGSASAALLVYAAWLAHRRRSWLPLIFWAAAGITMFIEPVCDVMGEAVHSQVGQTTIFTVQEHPIPLYVPLVYPVYYGLLLIVLFDRVVDRTIPKHLWWKIAAVAAVGVCGIEQIPIHYGLWHFYGDQPLKIGLMASDMVAMNLTSVIVPSLVVYRLLPVLSGWRQLLVLGLFPAFAMAGHAGAGLFSYDAIGIDGIGWLVQGADALTVAMGGLMVWAMLELVYHRPEEPSREQSSAEVAASR